VDGSHRSSQRIVRGKRLSRLCSKERKPARGRRNEASVMETWDAKGSEGSADVNIMYDVYIDN
jgi:hypothetical protein